MRFDYSVANKDLCSQLPFFPPLIELPGLHNCCQPSTRDAFIDHARGYHKFSVRVLAWAIQNMVDSGCIERYIETCDPVLLKANIKNLVKAAPGEPLFPILYFAVERNSPEILSMLCKAGADPSQKYRPLDLATAPIPLLAYTVMRAEYDMSDTTDSLVAFVAKGADPKDVPKDMWHEYLKAPLKDIADRIDATNAPNRWCTQEVREALCRNLTLLQRYILWKAEKITKPQVREKHDARAHGTMPLFEAPYNIIGQQQATTQVIEWIMLHYCTKNDEPLILLFTGPSGHGKTQLAQDMGRLLSLDIFTVDCTSKQNETDMFVPQAPYMGYKEGSSLNNHLVKMAGQKTVIFLDEFDKTTDEVHKAMLLLFESGQYRDRRENNRVVDCKHVIWILAANFAHEIIKGFWAKYIKNQSDQERGKAPFSQLENSVRDYVKDTIGAPLTGRITGFVPFLPFVEAEQAVVAYKFMREIWHTVRKPINTGSGDLKRLAFLHFVDDGKIALYLAKREYDIDLGARSLASAVKRNVLRPFRKAFDQHDSEVADKMNCCLLENFEIRLVNEIEGESVLVERVGFRSSKHRKQRHPFNDVWDTLELGPVVREFER